MENITGGLKLPQIKVSKWFIFLVLVLLLPLLGLVVCASVLVLPFYFYFQYLEKKKKIEFLMFKKQQQKNGISKRNNINI
jgi:hypothetical protein